MRKAILVPLLLVSTTTWAKRPVEELLLPAELNLYRQKPQYRARMDLFRKVLERQVGQLTRLAQAQSLEPAQNLLEDIRWLCIHGITETQEADRRDFRSKQVRKLEIRIRHLATAVDDLKKSFLVEQHSLFETTVRHLEAFRNQLLGQLFDNSLSLPEPGLLSAFPRAPATARSASQRPGVLTITGDQFTDREYTAIQQAQELFKRVEVFLNITASRMEEIQRRIQQRKWTEKDPNALEFYTNAQLMRAYQRAVEGIMINIDEKAKYRFVTKKDIRKSLKKLNSTMVEFLPLLKTFTAFSIQEQDQEFYRQIQQALKSSEIARKGSQMGLGAPVK